MKVRRSKAPTRMSERGFAASRLALGLLIAGALALGLKPTVVWAQAVNGSIVGTITDQTGAVVPGAKVTLTEENKNVSRSTSTDASGNYSFPDVPPGTYKVTVEEQGFATAASSAWRRPGLNPNISKNCAVPSLVGLRPVARSPLRRYRGANLRLMFPIGIDQRLPGLPVLLPLSLEAPDSLVFRTYVEMQGSE